MKQFFLIFASIFLLSFSAFAQQSFKHTVAKEETIAQIAQKYKVTPLDIYTLNPDARNGIKEKMVLLIPLKSQVKLPEKETKPAENQASGSDKTHTVEPKETVYGLAKLYEITVSDLEKANPEIKSDGLKIGQVITIPSNKAAISLFKEDKKEIKKENKKEDKKAWAKDAQDTGENIVHEVMPKETKYFISNKYGISIEELDRKNPEAKEGLKIGQRLIIKGSLANQTAKNAAEIKDSSIPEANYTTYEVKPKETLYSLSRQFGLSQNDLIVLNPDLSKGLNIGMILKIPSAVPAANAGKKNFSDLTRSLYTKNKKELVLLLPFNISKIQNDTASSVQERLKKDNFLNMTLDFYSGALIAIDSAKTLGLNIDVKILDSQENKNSSIISNSFVQKNLSKADVVVGPFYQVHAEKTAELLNEENIPVISPLSKEGGKILSNLYQSMPLVESLKNAMFDYLNQKKGNIVAVVDPKKGSIRKYITDNHPQARFALFNETGGLSVESLKGLLVKNQMNYVIMETANTWMIKATITTLLSAKPEYQVQLVILEPNDTLNSEEILISNLAKLKLLYASVTRENETPEASIFAKVYRKKNNIFPNQYATRGFDVTFDAMLRLSQEKSFEETIFDDATEQVENKFNYNRNPVGGYSNKGVYILYYDEDLNVKEAQ